MIIEGNVAFSNLTEHEVYKGTSTGKYSVTLTLEEDAAKALETSGVRIKEYEGKGQRKFATQFDVVVVDAEGNRYTREIPRGSLVRVKYKLGNESPQWGTAVYLEKIRVLEEAEPFMDDDGDDGDF